MRLGTTTKKGGNEVANVGLLYVGAVLFLNSIMLLGRIDGKSAAIFNVFIGLLQIFTPIYLIVSAKGDAAIILSASGIVLFGFTYLYVGLTNWFNIKTKGLGWYCLWVAIIALGFAYVNFTTFSDIKFGIIWLFWSFLWLLFFLLLGLELPIDRYVGKVTFVQSWITATIPAFLSLTGLWEQVSIMTASIIALLAVIYFVYAYFSSGTPKQIEQTEELT